MFSVILTLNAEIQIICYFHLKILSWSFQNPLTHQEYISIVPSRKVTQLSDPRYQNALVHLSKGLNTAQQIPARFCDVRIRHYLIFITTL